MKKTLSTLALSLFAFTGIAQAADITVENEMCIRDSAIMISKVSGSFNLPALPKCLTNTFFTPLATNALDVYKRQMHGCTVFAVSILKCSLISI